MKNEKEIINETDNSVNKYTQNILNKIRELFKDKKNIAIVILIILLSISLGSSNTDTTSIVNELKSEIEQLTANNNELKLQLEQSTSDNNELKKQVEQSNSKNIELENTLKELQKEKNEVTNISSEVQTQSTPNNPPSITEKSSSNDTISNAYILNKNTKVFHKPGCSSISKMKDSNKEEYTGSRDSVISMGYKSCQRCNP